MKTMATYFQNSKEAPVVYGEINLINPKRRKLKEEPLLEGIEAFPVFCGFCGTDLALMRMGQRGELSKKFPPCQNRLINGHEGIVYVPSEKRFAIVLIRGGDSHDPTRYTEGESYFEYGCDGADGIFCDKGYFNPDMLLRIPTKYTMDKKIPLSLAKRLVFSDPYACAVFQHERITDLGIGQNFRVEMAKRKCSPEEAMHYAESSTFDRVVVFGMGTTGLFMGDQVRRNHPYAKLLFVDKCEDNCKKVLFAKDTLNCNYLCCENMSEAETASAIVEQLEGKATVFIGASGSETEHRIAFKHEALGCNGIYDSFSLGPTVSFDTMPFGFKNQIIFSSINFTQKHMEKAISLLCDSRFDLLVDLIDKDEFTDSPMNAYVEKIYTKSALLKTAVIWNPQYIDETR